MGKTLLEFQSTKGDVLPAHKVSLLQMELIFFYLHLLVYSYAFFFWVSHMEEHDPLQSELILFE